MAKVYRFTDGETLTPEDDALIYKDEVVQIMIALKMGYVEQGYDAIAARTAADIFLHSDDLFLVVGDTWIAGFTSDTPWHLVDKFIAEEFFGARPGQQMDLEDFIAGGCALGKQEGCRFLEFGTRSNPRHAALARLANRYGAAVSAITLRKEIE